MAASAIVDFPLPRLPDEGHDLSGQQRQIDILKCHDRAAGGIVGDGQIVQGQCRSSRQEVLPPRGSDMSRNPSPIRLSDSAVRQIARPGKNRIQGALFM